MKPEDNRLLKFVSLSRLAYGKYKFQIFTLIVLGFVSGILEGIGVNALIPLFSFVIKGSNPATDKISQAIENVFGFFHISFSLVYLVVLIAILFVGKALVSLYLNYIKIQITSDYEVKTKNRLFQAILATNWPHLIKQKLGHLETVLSIDVPASASLLDTISSGIITATSLIIYLLVAINISTIITLVVLALGGFLFLILKPMNFKIKTLAYQRTKLNRETAHHISENLVGIKTVKATGVTEGVAKRGESLFADYKRISVRTSFLKSLSGSLAQPVSVIVICFIFVFSAQTANLNIAVLAAIVYLVERIFIYFLQMQRSLHSVNDLLPHVVSISNYEKTALENKEKNSGTAPFVFKNNLEFKNVRFAYNSDTQILKDINLDISRGELIGLVGPSGVGKTTLVDLVLRLLNPTSGKILLDGKDIQQIKLDDWRENIGYVSQEMFLTNDTIASNIRYFKDSITDREMEEAAKMANIYEFIQECPNKFQTIVGERGSFLSAGQRQRVVIARVLARRPKILILDEATSALDNESELQIQEVIKKLHGKVTVIAIAHRLSTIQDFDRLIVLKDGGIFEQGQPRQLLQNKDSYFFRVQNLKEA